jgi:hypothetical protein
MWDQTKPSRWKIMTTSLVVKKTMSNLMRTSHTPAKTDEVTFLSYAMAGTRRGLTGSLFLDCLLGGLFLSFLMDTVET